jgi:two-component system, response regulator
VNDNGVELLLVEDDPSDVQLTLRAFRKMGLANHVKVVRDGEEALKLIFGSGDEECAGMQDCRVVLLDLKLPKVPGIEVLRRLKADPRTQALPVVVLTSSREDRDMAECYRLGVNSYIVKPVDFEQFFQSVQSLGLYWLLLNQLPKI